MPGMIDTHRHMWQTAMRGYGADWTLTQYFVWYYLEHGKKFRPEDIARRQPAGRASRRSTPASPPPSTGRTACRPSSTPRPRSTRCRSVPGRFVLAYGNIQAGPWEWTADPGVPRLRSSRRVDAGDDMLGFQMAFDVTGDPAFPEKAAFEVARELGVPVTTHAGVWGATNDDGIRLMHDDGFMTPETDLRARRHADRRLLPADRRHRRLGLGVHRERAERRAGLPAHLGAAAHDIPVSLSMDTSVWWSGDLFSAMRTTLGADRSREHLEAHAKGDTITHCALRAEQVVEWATRGGAHGARPRRRPGQPRAGQEGRRRADQERRARRCRSRCSTRTGTSRSRPSAATCTPCWSTAGW